MSNIENKVLIIRMSSFGDIVQCQSVLASIKKNFSSSEIHWIVRSEFRAILDVNPLVDKVWSFDRKNGLLGLLKLGLKLRKLGFTHIYDAHSTIRSHILSAIITPFWGQVNFVRRSKDRWKRFLLFKLKKNTFPWPYKGMISYLSPLESKWNLLKERNFIQSWNFDNNSKVKSLSLDNFIALAPSAAWEMKRWPLDNWKKLIQIMPKQKFVVLGGPQDLFCKELEEIAPERVSNLAGKLSLIESCEVITMASSLVSADTGLLHVADILGVKSVGLIGPTAFGFTTGNHVQILTSNLPCMPCSKDGRGRCSQDVYQKCMIEITAENVAEQIKTYPDNF